MRILFFAAAVALVGCGAGSPRDWKPFDGQAALQFAADQMAFGARVPGSEAHGQTGDWIAGQLQGSGWQVQEQPFVYRGTQLRNFIASAGLAGGDLLLLGAHYDTRPVADQNPVPTDLPVPGANDGASGVAVLLALARALPPGQLSCRVQLAFLDAEDSGDLKGWDWIVGARYLAANLQDLPQAVVILDMIGDADLQIFYEHNSTEALRAEIWAVAQSLGNPGFISETKYSMLDDHRPFLDLGVPAVDVIDFDYPYWHTTEDTLDKLSAESLAQAGTTMLEWIRSRCP